MKRNIDLTTNGIFSGLDGILRAPENFGNFIEKKIRKMKGEKYPWSFSSRVTGRNGELFYTGNKKERQLKRDYEIRDFYSCDCCGKRNIKKWDFKYTLCMDCNNQLEEMQRLKDIWILDNYGTHARNIDRF